MFRIEFFVQDKHLPTALRALTGLAVGNPSVHPVVNAEAKPNGKLTAETSGTLTELFLRWLDTEAPDRITSSDTRTFLESIGSSPSNANYVQAHAQKAGRLKKFGTGFNTSYKVVR